MDSTETLIVLIPTTAVGLLIGKGGQFFKFMGHLSGAKLYLQSFEEMVAGSRDRTLSITGTRESVMSAVQMVLQRLQAQLSEEQTEQLRRSDETLDKAVLQWIIPQSMTGFLIGKHGSRIKMINEHSGAWVKIAHPEEVPPSMGERTVYIRGSKAQTQVAVEMVQRVAGGRSGGLEDKPIVIPRCAQDAILAHIPDHVVEVIVPHTTGIASVAIIVHDSRFNQVIEQRLEHWNATHYNSLHSLVSSTNVDHVRDTIDMCLVILVPTSTLSTSHDDDDDDAVKVERIEESVHNSNFTKVVSLVAPLKQILSKVQQFIMSSGPPEAKRELRRPTADQFNRRNLSPEDLWSSGRAHVATHPVATQSTTQSTTQSATHHPATQSVVYPYGL